jgi:hypothetical protein
VSRGQGMKLRPLATTEKIYFLAGPVLAGGL